MTWDTIIDKETDALEDIAAGISLEDFEKKYGNAGRALSRLIRPAVSTKPGYILVWGDWSNIEARTLPWLARAEDRLDLFRRIDKDPENEPDVYLHAVAGMYNHDPYELLQRRLDGDKEVKSLRQRGKIAELALGFAGGNGALNSMAAAYGMAFTQEEATDIVKRWRAANKWAETFWDDLWEAFLSAYSNPDGTMYEAGRLKYQGLDGFFGVTVICYMPDGYPLVYRNVRHKKHIERDPFDESIILEERMELVCDTSKGVKKIWKGLLAENPTQAAAARVLRVTLRYLEKPGFDFMPVVGHTHDEIITLTSEANEEAAKAQLERAMVKDWGWNEGLPTAAEVQSHYHYTKALED